MNATCLFSVHGCHTAPIRTDRSPIRSDPHRSVQEEYKFGDVTKAAVNKTMDAIGDFTGKKDYKWLGEEVFLGEVLRALSLTVYIPIQRERERLERAIKAWLVLS